MLAFIVLSGYRIDIHITDKIKYIHQAFKQKTLETVGLSIKDFTIKCYSFVYSTSLSMI